MKSITKFFLLSIVTSFVLSISARAAENSTIALITKTVQAVTRKNPPNDWAKALRGDALVSGDQVQTGRKSLAIVKFADNSIIRVRELSLLTILGQSSEPGALSKTVRLDGGTFGFDVRKQKQNEQFHLTSPTSVASIRGTKGKLSGGLGNDTLVVTEGLVNLKNTASGKDVDVPAGFVGFSNQDGTVTTRKASEQELADANTAATGGSSSHELNLEMKDSQGNKKELKIRYK